MSERVLNEKALIYPDTRHTTTLMLSIYLKEKGVSLNETIAMVSDVINNTYQHRRGLIDPDTKLEHSLREVERLSGLVFERDYSMGSGKPEPIRVYKEDILATLKTKRKPLRQLLFSMICHGKKYAKSDGTFYMAYSVMTDMGNTQNRSRLLEYTDKLEAEGHIEVVRRGKKIKGSSLNEVNVYKVNYQQASDNSKYIELDKVCVDDWASVVTQLVSEEELKAFVSSKIFYSTFKEYYIK